MKTLREVAAHAIVIICKHEEAAFADAGYDAGEFSGPAHSSMEEQEITKLAEANGFTFDEVMDEVITIENEANDTFQ